MGEGGRELAGYEAVAAAKVDEEVRGTAVVGKYGLEDCGWVGGSEGGVGECVESCFGEGRHAGGLRV